MWETELDLEACDEAAECLDTTDEGSMDAEPLPDKAAEEPSSAPENDGLT